MFDKTLEIAEELKFKSDIESRSLSTLEKLNLANDCLEQVHDQTEYLEIKQIRDELKKEWQMEKDLLNKGFAKKKPQYVTNEEAETILKTVNKEFSAAEKEYLKLTKQAEELEKKYKADMKALKKQIHEIEQAYSQAYYVNSYLPFGYDSIIRQIKANSWVYSDVAAAKTEYRPHTEAMGLFRTRPIKKGGRR